LSSLPGNGKLAQIREYVATQALALASVNDP
jgi:hypothetical protein